MILLPLIFPIGASRSHDEVVMSAIVLIGLVVAIAFAAYIGFAPLCVGQWNGHEAPRIPCPLPLAGLAFIGAWIGTIVIGLAANIVITSVRVLIRAARSSR